MPLTVSEEERDHKISVRRRVSYNGVSRCKPGVVHAERHNMALLPVE